MSGLTVSGPLFAAVLAAMPQTQENPSGQPRPVVPSAARFDETTFTDFVDAQHVSFSASCSMAAAVFEKGVLWNGSRFHSLDLRKAVIHERADFGNVVIGGAANWSGLRSSTLLAFAQGQVHGDLLLDWCAASGIWLSKTRIMGQLSLREANLVGEEDRSALPSFARFDGMAVERTVDFTRTRFPYETTVNGYADMNPTEIKGALHLDGCTFGTATQGGRHLLQNLNLDGASLSDCEFFGRVSFARCYATSPIVITNAHVRQSDAPVEPDRNDYLFPKPQFDLTDLDLGAGGRLDGVHVDGSVAMSCVGLDGELEVSLSATESVDMTGTTPAYAALEVDAGSRIEFRRCLFQRGGVISCSTPHLGFSECDARQPLVVAESSVGTATLVELNRTNVEQMVLSGLDLRYAVFRDVSNLDKLRVQGAPWFHRAPRRFGTGRQVLQDEVILRDAAGEKRWRPLLRPGADVAGSTAADVAAVYRSLRKSREDAKDEPGGADFYYGEMEMRRRTVGVFTVENSLLAAYAWTSGYALRAWRAVAALIGVLILGGILLDRYGYEDGGAVADERADGVIEQSLLLMQVAVALTRMPPDLTMSGEAVVVAVRLVVPVLLALALLAIRNRVRR
jgi:uncharacterized protein YjbI with pentapeptide repeats